ncbi:MAG: MotA/TolQ/ExbB proton channel family protein [Candidatus Krumholzibacteriota bacterium]|nr:MotA/TolQ/ExbB proton channel family protein [Candidatus Krumholzibacteriota bacterium]
MVEKFRFFRRARSESNRFLARFGEARSLDEVRDGGRSLPESPEAALVRSLPEGREADVLRDPAFLDRFLESSAGRIVSDWESYLVFLATTATVSPFLGLLGTVWGIMSSFLSMGARGSADLYVVGPGIAEALITTIFGLAAAIPAVIGYNYILRVIRRREDELAMFAARLRSRILEG